MEKPGETAPFDKGIAKIHTRLFGPGDYIRNHAHTLSEPRGIACTRL